MGVSYYRITPTPEEIDMCMGGGGKSSPPPPPPPPPQMPREPASDIRRRRVGEAPQGGGSAESTLLTGPGGAKAGQLGQTTLLGGA